MIENNKVAWSGGLLAWAMFTLGFAYYAHLEFSKIWVRQLKDEQAIGKIRSDNARWMEQFERFQIVAQREKEILLSLQQEVLQGREQLARLKGDREWVLSEVKYLAFLAQERLQAFQDISTAIRQLREAQKLLAKQADPKLNDLKAAIGSDLDKLSKVIPVDKTKLWDEVNLLSDKINQLSIKILGEAPVVSGKETLALPAWRRAWQASWETFQDLIKITRLEKNPIPTALATKEQVQLRYGVQLLNEQIRWSILQGNEVIYRDTIQKLIEIVKLFYAETQTQQAILAQLNVLMAQPIVVPIPSLSQTFDALNHLSG